MAHLGAVHNDGPLAHERVGREILLAGLGAGLLGGLVMALWLVLHSARSGADPLELLRLMGATFRGPEALAVGTGVIVYGALVHLATSAALGVLFTAVVGRDFPGGSSIAMGVGYGCIVMAIMTSVVLPRVNPVLAEQLPNFGGAWVLACAAFGSTLSIAPALRRRIAARPARAESQDQVQRSL